jgi:Protein of unknown function (DUF3047)
MKAVWLAAFVTLALFSSVPEETPTPHVRLERCFRELAASGANAPPECFLDVVRDLAPKVLGARFQTATEGEKFRFERAFASALRRVIPSGANVARKRVDSDSRGSRLLYQVNDGENDLGEATVLLSSAGSYLDLLWNGDSVVRRYHEECERTIERYSFAYLVGELEGEGVVVLEDFEDGPLGQPPVQWQPRGFGEVDAKEKSPYRVRSENGNRFLRAEDRGENVMLYKEVRWDSRKYPYLGFRWRIRAVPSGSDERIEDKADSAAGLYLSYGRKLGIVPETVKFIWSGTLAAGTAFRRPGIGMPWTIVAGDGPAEETTWHRFVFETGRVYEETFGKPSDGRPLGIGLLTDANATGGFASADYDDIVALAHSATENRIRRFEKLPTR